MTELPVSAFLDQYRRRLGLSAEACWAAYFEMGGHGDPAALAAFLDGRRALPRPEVDILAAAIFDLSPPGQGWESAPALRALIDGPVLGQGAATTLEAVAAHLVGRPVRDRATPPVPEAEPSARALRAPQPPFQLNESELAIRSAATTTIRTVTAPPDGLLPLADPASGSRLRVSPATNPAWELHTTGEELLVLISGEVRIEFDRVDPVITTLRRPYEACVVPRGRWHRHQATQADTTVLFLTPAEEGGAAHTEPPTGA